MCMLYATKIGVYIFVYCRTYKNTMYNIKIYKLYDIYVLYDIFIILTFSNIYVKIMKRKL